MFKKMKKIECFLEIWVWCAGLPVLSKQVKPSVCKFLPERKGIGRSLRMSLVNDNVLDQLFRQ
jgi:hypothetical protein